MFSDERAEFRTLPARYYTDAQVFREEIDGFFFDSWIWVGRSEHVRKPGDYFLREIATESLIIVRDSAGRIRAFYNLCRHRGTRICTQQQGVFDGRIQCPYHGWTYNLEGKLLGAPYMESSFVREDFPLHEIATAIWDGHVFLHMGTRPEPLAKHLAELPAKFAPWRMEELRLHRRIAYDVKANWKLLISNYNECLHCPSVHPVRVVLSSG